MAHAQQVRIAVDSMGGDLAPGAVLEGVAAALEADPALDVLLVGPADVVGLFAADHERCVAVPASEVVTMDDHAATAVRTKKDASVVVGCRLVRDGDADGFLSAGSTGAVMTAAILVVGRIRGVLRPAIAAVLPTAEAPCVFLDVGANADCRPEYLVQFAQMGAAYSQATLGVSSPRIALLNIGEEEGKGSRLAQEAYALLERDVVGFIGNIEGRGVPAGAADVVVTDGFTGNVALKLMEGMSRQLLVQFKDAMLSSALSKVAATVLKPSLESLRDRLDPDQHGAAPLLGVNGLTLIAHGSSSPRAITSALRVGAMAVRGDLLGKTRAALRLTDA